MNLYNLIEFENHIELLAKSNDGEIDEDQLKQLVELQTQSLIQIENLCKYLRNIDLLSEACDKEIERIKNLKEKANKRSNSIKNYLIPYIVKQGVVETNLFKLSVRKSKKVEVVNGFNNLAYCNVKEVVTPDKTAIKKAIESGIVIDGAELVETSNLQIK
jgi:hypothetical protein